MNLVSRRTPSLNRTILVPLILNLPAGLGRGGQKLSFIPYRPPPQKKFVAFLHITKSLTRCFPSTQGWSDALFENTLDPEEKKDFFTFLLAWCKSWTRFFCLVVRSHFFFCRLSCQSKKKGSFAFPIRMRMKEEYDCRSKNYLASFLFCARPL